jgi:TRAP-type C4-dicarboxylate transport system permease small subunit
MIRALERFCEIFERLAALLLGFVTILIVASTVGRYGFSYPIPDSFDFSRLLIAACIMWGFASVGYRGGHIMVDMFAEMMPPRARRIVDIFSWCMLLFFVVLMTWKIFERVLSAMRSNESTFDLRLAVWPILLLIWVGAATSVLTITVRIYLLITGRGDLASSEKAELEVK